MHPARAGMALLLASCALPAGCALHRRGGEVVRSIHFDGNGNIFDGTADFHLRKAMLQEQSPWLAFVLPWVDPVPLDREALEGDAWRIEVWYAHHGFFDARFLGWDIRTRRMAGRIHGPQGRQRPAVLEIRGRVEPGEPSLVRELRFEGLDKVGGPLAALIRRDCEVVPGERFDLDAVQETEALILHRLRELSYARARVSSRVEAHPEEHAVDVTFEVDTGPSCRFGEVEIRGNERVPAELIEDELPIEPGESFRASVLERARARLYALGTFSMVDVRPAPPGQSPDPRVVPVVVELRESRFQTLRTGLGLGVESGRQDAHLSFSYRHANLFDRLFRLDLEGSLGYAVVASFEDVASGVDLLQSPTASADLDFTWPRVFGRRWRFNQAFGYERGLESTYRFERREARPSFTFQATERLAWTLGYSLEHYDYLESGEELDLSTLTDPALGLDVTDPFLLGMFEQKLVWEGRDDVLFTRRGTYAALSLAVAGSPWTSEVDTALLGNYNFVKAFADLRGYASLAPKLHLQRGLVLATRVPGGLAEPYGQDERAAVPYAERFYLGGGTTVRGWVEDHLGPYLCKGDDGYTAPVPGEACADVTPIGGRMVLYGSVELRKSLPWDTGVVLFLDAGELLDQPALELGELHPSAGVGFRYASPVGPVRLDLAVRLDHDPLFAGEPPMNLHFSLAEAF